MLASVFHNTTWGNTDCWGFCSILLLFSFFIVVSINECSDINCQSLKKKKRDPQTAVYFINIDETCENASATRDVTKQVCFLLTPFRTQKNLQYIPFFLPYWFWPDTAINTCQCNAMVWYNMIWLKLLKLMLCNVDIYRCL